MRPSRLGHTGQGSFNPDAYKNGQERLLAYMSANVRKWLTVDDLRVNTWLQEPTRAIRYLRQRGYEISMKPAPHHRFKYRLLSLDPVDPDMLS